MSYNKILGNAESSGKYNAENTIGYLGKYQMGASALQDLGYVNPKPKGISQKAWLNKSEAWTGKNGITSKQDFLMNGNEQEEAQTGWNNLLDKRTKALKLDKYIGKEMNGITLTNDMIRGMSHLAGHGNVKKALASGDLTSWKDAYGTTMFDYANKFKEEQPMQSKKPNAYEQWSKAALLDRENGTGVTYSNTQTRPLMDEPTNNTGKEYGYSGGGKDWATSRNMGGVPEGVTLPEDKPKESKPALVVDEGTFEGIPDIEYEAQEVGGTTEPVQSPLAKTVDQGMTEITPDGQEQEVSWWVRPAQGLFSGLRDFGMTLLQTGGDYNAAAAAGMDTLLRPLDSEYRERQDQLQRKQYVTKLVDSGKLDPAKADAYIKTGNTSYLEQSQTLKPSDAIAMQRLEFDKRKHEEQQASSDYKAREAARETYEMNNQVVQRGTKLLSNPNLDDVIGNVSGRINFSLSQDNQDAWNELKALSIQLGLANREKMGPGPMTDKDFPVLMEAYGLNATASPQQFRARLNQVISDAKFNVHRLDKRFNFGGERQAYDEQQRGATTTSNFSSLWR